MEIFLDKATKQIEKNLPFVVYKKPDEANVIGLFQENDTLFEVNDFTEKGFVFASFDGSQTLIIPENQSEIINVDRIEDKTDIPEKEANLPNEVARNNFETLVAKGIQAIENNEFKKVVLSRKETVDLVDFDLVTAFGKLVQLYPSTFVYCFFHPKVGIWLGATPEQLLKVKNNAFETIALAGTQKDTGSVEVIWAKKEEEEQQFVTDYIVERLKDVASEVIVSKPYSIKAGSIWHIKTDISGVLNSSSSLQKVIQLLHPTPAVCGLPKNKSKAFILENENYDRTFYTGYLGELNSSLAKDSISSDLFVNLRCMEICDSQAHLYMGCGVTKDSIPGKEWEESINKSATMKRSLDF
ncbi:MULTISPECIES: isochorismate synthase [unclassified Flavobacterium]|uniref:isochorismate synthase n=1 Tax=unclassified Flavobacterium TaxID=196869 RepID=UPI0025C2FA51|nr:MULTISPECIES: isochorismate synthase [unclassified Flavobacterium]